MSISRRVTINVNDHISGSEYDAIAEWLGDGLDIFNAEFRYQFLDSLLKHGSLSVVITKGIEENFNRLTTPNNIEISFSGA